MSDFNTHNLTDEEIIKAHSHALRMKNMKEFTQLMRVKKKQELGMTATEAYQDFVNRRNQKQGNIE